MIKILELGYEFPSTHEPLVSILDEVLIKTASSDIQHFWNTFERKKDKGYLHVIALSAGEFYGCNNNGDWFKESDLKQYHPSFVTDGNIFMFHQNKDPRLSLGKPIYSTYNDGMHRVELVLEFAKTDPKAKILMEKIKTGEQIFVSMGVRVSHDVCSICNNSSKVRSSYCNHLKFNMKKILPDGKQVYALNPGPLKFFDISIVNRPADRAAFELQKEAGDKEQEVISSAELGERYESTQAKLASLKKLSDMIKFIDGDIVNIDDMDEKDKNAYSILKALKNQNVRHIEYPTMDFESMDELDASPGAMIRIFINSGAPPSLGELAYISGKHSMGDSFKEDMIPKVLSLLQPAIAMLQNKPDSVEDILSDVLGNYKGELDNDASARRLTELTSPTIQKRILVIKQACESGQLEKIANEMMGRQDTMKFKQNTNNDIISLAKSIVRRNADNSIPMLTTHKVKDSNGNEYITNSGNILTSRIGDGMGVVIPKMLGLSVITAGLLTMMSDATLLQKVLTGAGSLAVGKWLGGIGTEKYRIQTEQSMEIPNNTVFSRVHTPLTKMGVDHSAELKGLWKNNKAAVVGLTIPTVLGLDYLYNKHVKYRNDPYLEENLSPAGRLAHRAGRVVVDNPISTMAGGGIGATILSEMLKNKFKRN